MSAKIATDVLGMIPPGISFCCFLQGCFQNSPRNCKDFYQDSFCHSSKKFYWDSPVISARVTQKRFQYFNCDLLSEYLLRFTYEFQLELIQQFFMEFLQELLPRFLQKNCCGFLQRFLKKFLLRFLQEYQMRFYQNFLQRFVQRFLVGFFLEYLLNFFSNLAKNFSSDFLQVFLNLFLFVDFNFLLILHQQTALNGLFCFWHYHSVSHEIEFATIDDYFHDVCSLKTSSSSSMGVASSSVRGGGVSWVYEHP